MKKIFCILLFFGVANFGFCADTLFQKGLNHLAQGDFVKAQSYFIESTTAAPSFAGYYNLGIASGFLEDWNLVKWAFESALKYDPNYENAEYNSRLATQQIDENQEWTHPYSWTERVLVGLPPTLLLVLSIVLSLFLGVLIYSSILGFKKESFLKKWRFQLIFWSFSLFCFFVFTLSFQKKHFSTYQFAVMKTKTTPFFISPEGVKTNDFVSPAERFKIIDYSKDSTWIKLKLINGNQLWAKTKDFWQY